MYVSGKVLGTKGEAVPDAVMDTWETDDQGYVLYPLLSIFCVFASGRIRAYAFNLLSIFMNTC